jgi:hypothetical protein
LSKTKTNRTLKRTRVMMSLRFLLMAAQVEANPFQSLGPNWLSWAWTRYRSKSARSVGPWRRGRLGAWCRRRAGKRSRHTTPNRHAQSDSNCVNAPAFAGAAVVAGHSPAEPAARGE